MHDTDRDWEYFGRTDPYWAVSTADRFRSDKLDDKARGEFFAAGEKYIARVLDTIRTRLDAGFEPARALDFGCGVGRLAFPLARRCESVVGVDVSESMLREADVQAKTQGTTNISWVKGDDELSGVTGRFDLINSYIVFQHIPCHRGQRLFKRLVDLLNHGGVGVIHLTYSRSSLDADPCVAWPASAPAYSARPLHDLKCYLFAVKRVLRRRVRKLSGKDQKTSGEPAMQMNPYTLNPLLHILQLAGIRTLHVEFINDGGEYGVILFFQKPRESQ